MGAFTQKRATGLLFAYERAPEHADPLANHTDVEAVLRLEVRDDVLQSGVSLELESIPECPLRRSVFILHGANRLRETEEGQGEIDEAVLVVFEFTFAIDDLEIFDQRDAMACKRWVGAPCRAPNKPNP
jgi:hypothetical protein